ncbi:hypothetical protein CXG81DRAFT_12171 [Caulochytrium protostelioides]|uniref:Elongation factor G, mitochondrial n=1 Tax=Caulochytrium protostelioides TaxID=1555241 RepID=A0A4P9X7U0_9FUNG|nr:translation elongation factor G [Caulochytrium protostelioides]RKP01292.1 hypothetical protein CXG81DRAFT_12171 [Caulochytrium protostelioides]|eukprot:RKP01292.1 hypothetical protein CXG81DRAFT_12171 [Caulochytrium protostelioides]
MHGRSVTEPAAQPILRAFASITARKPTTSTLLPTFQGVRSYATPTQNLSTDGYNYSPEELTRLRSLRNIGISAHIDSGKTTLTERILYYTGRIDDIHEVRGKDNVGATMDSMDLEREKGITIQSAATYTSWKDYSINIIDTPGHVDFTIEVERALRVLDGAILVLCAVAGVQSQSITVDRQMRRYNVPRVAFINKMDRAGANPWRVIEQLRTKLRLNAAAVQIPIGSENDLAGVVDLVRGKAYYNEGIKGTIVREGPIPEDLMEQYTTKRAELIENLADADDTIAEMFLAEQDPTPQQLEDAIRRATLKNAFCAVFVGSAYHNTGVQPLLDGVGHYLPAPHEVTNYEAADERNPTSDKSSQVVIPSASDEPLVALAFKLEEGRFGQLTYLRVYQGSLRRGDWLVNVRTGKRIKIPRVVRMHSNEMEDVEIVPSGEICALFGVDCASGDSFGDGKSALTMSSIFVPEPVISLSVSVKGRETPNFSKALNRFQKEDPTFRVTVDPESKETIISGMGELHLEIYIERMKREYKTECTTGKPRVAFRETIQQKVEFNYTHKKQSGGSGQFGRVIGYIEPMEKPNEKGETLEFVNAVVGMNIPKGYIPSIEKGFLEACQKGFLTGHPITNVRFVLEDGLAHAVDSSELAFKTAAAYAFREAFMQAQPQILEPIMAVDLTLPAEAQGNGISLLNKRKGTIGDTEVVDDYVQIAAEVPLNDMFGFSTALRSITQGKGEFAMEYLKHEPVQPQVQMQLMDEHRKAGQKK